MGLLQKRGERVGMDNVSAVFTDDEDAILVVHKLTRRPAHILEATVQRPHQVFRGERLILKNTPFVSGTAQ